MMIDSGMETFLWQRAEWTLQSDTVYANPLQEAELIATFTSPSGKTVRSYGFWDGGTTWRVRFAPDEPGTWSLSTSCSDISNEGLHSESVFRCADRANGKGEKSLTPFGAHGAISVSEDGRHFEHADGSPFFYLADTCWNGPLLSTDMDWAYYLNKRRQQSFTAVQWVATQWLAAPAGDLTGAKAYEGERTISLTLDFFRRLERRHTAIISAGLLSVPVLLWAANWNEEATRDNPGATLAADQAILLARYMVARWNADPVVWFLAGDAPYQGDYADRWRRIGRGVFGDVWHAPVSLHPNGQQWTENFRSETWLDFISYQSGHGDGDDYNRWLLEGPPALNWKNEPFRPVINAEPAYENHRAYQSGQPFGAHAVRKRLYWSLLVHPTAGVAYGGHGVWGWDAGGTPPTAHSASGTPLAWRGALDMPAAQQIEHLHAVFTDLAWWRLRPAPELILEQSGVSSSEMFIVASATQEGDAAIIYAPDNKNLTLSLAALAPFDAVWVDPASGERQEATCEGPVSRAVFTVPGGKDRILLLTKRSR